ncbi:hypothetical protein MUK42_02171 [Musa troglodytarum]|uniref:RING-type E3 ubiquitin transferase n=1 Tax=Musa troglodytarum TaxID=320322 RepID=A0A9E7EXC8_9LILI|nr:hypothetical protein MUK42_02171 [Musa troglodytarum]
MEKRVMIFCAAAGFLGVLSAALAFAAEATRIKVSDVETTTLGECRYPRSPALALGLIAAVALIIAQTIINIVAGCICCKKYPNPSDTNWTIDVELEMQQISFWVTFIIAFVLLLSGAALNDRWGQERMYFGEFCYVVKSGVFSGGAVLSLASVALGIVYYISSVSLKNVQPCNSPQNQDIALVHATSWTLDRYRERIPHEVLPSLVGCAFEDSTQLQNLGSNGSLSVVDEQHSIANERSPALDAFDAWVLFAPFPSPSSPSISHRVAGNLSQFAKSSSADLIPTQSVSMDIPESQWTEDEFCAVGTETDRIPSYKSSASSGVKAGISSGSSVHELLECPVCTNSMFPPIHQCPNGHTLCSSCKQRVHNHCPTCRQELGNIRCLALEKVAESLELPCKYQHLGCSEIHPYYSKLKHEQLCRFRPYNCPYAGSECPVTGDIPMLVAHLKNDHKVDMHDGCTFNHRYVKPNPHEVENATWMLTVFSCYGHYFCLHFEAFLLGMAPVYMAFLRFLGEDSEARNFSYSLEVGGNGRKLIWQGVPRSIRDNHRKVRDSYDGLIIHRNMALFFSGGDRQELKLRVTGRIWKEQ